MNDRLQQLLARRFDCDGQDFAAVSQPAAAMLQMLAGHRVHRAFDSRPISDELVRTLLACALSAPSKSDLQQRDIIVVDRETQRRIADLTPGSPWVGEAARCVVLCADGNRVSSLYSRQNIPFPNDHFDLLFNSVGDAAIALAWLIIATEAVGLVGCPLSEVRNFPEQISEWLDLPPKVIPFAAYCFGWPKAEAPLSLRLPLEVTIHAGRFNHAGTMEMIDRYDARRQELQPYGEQRDVTRWGTSVTYGWTEDKVRQYSVEQRSSFGAYVRSRGFSTT